MLLLLLLLPGGCYIADGAGRQVQLDDESSSKNSYAKTLELLLWVLQHAASPPQDPCTLTFYTAPALECGFAAWHSSRLAQVLVRSTAPHIPALQNVRPGGPCFGLSAVAKLKRPQAQLVVGDQSQVVCQRKCARRRTRSSCCMCWRRAWWGWPTACRWARPCCCAGWCRRRSLLCPAPSPTSVLPGACCNTYSLKHVSWLAGYRALS